MAKHQSGARKRKKPAAKKSKKTGAKKGRKRGPKKGSKHTQAHNDAIAAGMRRMHKRRRALKRKGLL